MRKKQANMTSEVVETAAGMNYLDIVCLGVIYWIDNLRTRIGRHRIGHRIRQ